MKEAMLSLEKQNQETSIVESIDSDEDTHVDVLKIIQEFAHDVLPYYNDRSLSAALILEAQLEANEGMLGQTLEASLRNSISVHILQSYALWFGTPAH